MNTEFFIENFKEKYKSDILEINVRNQKRIIITITPDSIINIAAFLYTQEGFRFIIASALHTKKGFEIHYHFSKDSTGLILNIHVILDNDNPQIESLSNIFNASNWIEAFWYQFSQSPKSGETDIGRQLGRRRLSFEKGV